MAENFSKSDKNYGLPQIELTPIDREKPGIAKTAKASPASTNENKERRWVPIVLLIAFGLIAASLVYYFFWGADKTKDLVSDNDNPTVQEDRVTIADGEGNNDTASGGEDTGVAEGSDLNETSEVEALTEEPGTIVTISQRTERYYIFLGSYKFKAYARRHADRLAADGFAVKLIAPDNWVGMRVAVGNYASIAEASADASLIKDKYGNEVVVSKY